MCESRAPRLYFFFPSQRGRKGGNIAGLRQDTRDYAVTDDDGCFGVFRFIVAFFLRWLHGSSSLWKDWHRG